MKQEHNIFVLYSGHNLNILCLFFSCFFLNPACEPRCEASIKPRRESTRRREKIAIFMESRMFDFGNNVNVALCLCGYCIPMSTHIEFVCCLEKAGLPDRADRCLHEL